MLLSFVINPAVDTITRRSDGKATERAALLTPSDVARLKAAYGCADNNATVCFDHFQLAAATNRTAVSISSADRGYLGCTIVVSSLSARVVMETVKFKFDGCEEKVAVYSGTRRSEVNLVGEYCAGDVPGLIRSSQGITLDFATTSTEPAFQIDFYLQELDEDENEGAGKGVLGKWRLSFQPLVYSLLRQCHPRHFPDDRASVVVQRGVRALVENHLLDGKGLPCL